jgi:hypothetical protein
MDGTSSGGTVGGSRSAPALREPVLAACLLPMFGPIRQQYQYGLPDPCLNGKNYKSVKWIFLIAFHPNTSDENPKLSNVFNKLDV